MKFYSLNKNAPIVSFKEAVIRGIAPDLSGLSPLMQTIVAQGLALLAIGAILLIMRQLAIRQDRD